MTTVANTSGLLSDSTLRNAFEAEIFDLARGDVEVLEFEFAQSELGGQGLGITCRTCAEEFIGVRIFQIALESAATGKLQINDQIVMIDDVILISASLSDEQALHVVNERLSRTGCPLRLAVARPKPEDDFDVEWEQGLWTTSAQRDIEMLRAQHAVPSVDVPERRPEVDKTTYGQQRPRGAGNQPYMQLLSDAGDAVAGGHHGRYADEDVNDDEEIL